jgi:hypothetical protein
MENRKEGVHFSQNADPNSIANVIVEHDLGGKIREEQEVPLLSSLSWVSSPSLNVSFSSIDA